MGRSPERPMDYDHSRKAGNLGDVWKHFALVALADRITGKADTFHYVESHAGAPIHELRDRGEWRRGIGRVARDASFDCPYIATAREWLSLRRYPASWVFVVGRLARRFTNVRATLFDSSDQVAAQYQPTMDTLVPNNVRVGFRQGDGYAAAADLEDSDLVFLDPPFHPDAKTDWRLLEYACRDLTSRGLAFAAWYPFYWPTRPQALSDFTQCTSWEVSWTPCGSKPSQNLKGCGMLLSAGLARLFRDVEKDLVKMSACLQAELTVREPSSDDVQPTTTGELGRRG